MSKAMKKNAQYSIDHINGKIIISKRFNKEAQVLNTEAYNTLKQLRADNPTYTVELKEIQKKEGKKTYKNLSFERMENFLVIRMGADSDEVKQFKKVVALSDTQAGKYAYVKKWFLDNFKDIYTSIEVEIA